MERGGKEVSNGRTFRTGGAQLVEANLRGGVIARSNLRLACSVVTLAEDQRQFAFVGVPDGHSTADPGVYVADFQQTVAQRILGISLKEYEAEDIDEDATLDFSSDNTKLLFSHNGHVLVIDVNSRKYTEFDGGLAQWSPLGSWISFVDSQSRATLLNIVTRERKQFDPGHLVHIPMEWSPDGEYLLVLEAEGSHVPYGCFWIVRVVDNAFFPLQGYSVARPNPHWVRDAR